MALLRKSLVVLAVLALAGCGGHKATVAGCLNDAGFLVTAHGRTVEGQSPGGVGFTVLLGAHPRIDDRGNPGGRRLSRADRAAAERCLGAAVH